MIDVKIVKQFKDPDTWVDIYILSIQIDKNYYSMPVNKDQFQIIYQKLRSIQNNDPLE
jgi:hypothetical protein